MLKLFNKLIARFLPSASFGHSVGLLVGGTIGAQAINVLVLPAITRLYTPSDFGVLAIYSAALTIAMTVACLRMEIAIPLPENDDEAANLLALALIFPSIIAGLIAIIIFVFANEIAYMLGQSALRPFLWMLPLGIWMASVYSALQFWATRKKLFLVISRTRLNQGLFSAFVKLTIGWMAINGPFGLLIGQMLSSGAGIFSLGRAVFGSDRVRNISFPAMAEAFFKYKNFAKYSTFEALANICAIQLPIIIIGSALTGSEAGYLLLAMQTAALPLSLVGGAVSQVYLSKAANEYRHGSLPEFTSNVIGMLFKFGVGPIVCVGISSPDIFPLVFGDPWRRAGEMIMWMTPWFVMQFLSSPISMALHVTGNQKIALYNQIFGFIFRVGTVWFSSLYFVDYVFEFYAVSGLVFYFVYFGIIMRVSEVPLILVCAVFKSGVLQLLLWVLIGFCFFLPRIYFSN